MSGVAKVPSESIGQNYWKPASNIYIYNHHHMSHIDQSWRTVPVPFTMAMAWTQVFCRWTLKGLEDRSQSFALGPELRKVPPLADSWGWMMMDDDGCTMMHNDAQVCDEDLAVFPVFCWIRKERHIAAFSLSILVAVRDIYLGFQTGSIHIKSGPNWILHSPPVAGGMLSIDDWLTSYIRKAYRLPTVKIDHRHPKMDGRVDNYTTIYI